MTICYLAAYSRVRDVSNAVLRVEAQSTCKLFDIPIAMKLGVEYTIIRGVNLPSACNWRIILWSSWEPLKCWLVGTVGVLYAWLARQFCVCIVEHFNMGREMLLMLLKWLTTFAGPCILHQSYTQNSVLKFTQLLANSEVKYSICSLLSPTVLHSARTRQAGRANLNG